MTLPALLTPLAAALALAVGVTGAHRRLPPQLASRIIAVALGALLLAAAPTLLLVSVGYLTHGPLVGGSLEWCAKALGIHRPVPPAAGVIAVTLTSVAALRARRVVRDYRRLRTDGRGTVEIAHHDRPLAFTLPGRGGHIVLSTALVDLLDDHEREVVLAHERAHARHRHDRYLLIAQLAGAVLPVARPLARRLQFTLERWADEAAVGHCGDRSLVAHTLGKVALRNVGAGPALGFTGLGVPARVAALLAPPAGAPPSAIVGTMWTAIGATAALSMFQLHHVASLIGALCPG